MANLGATYAEFGTFSGTTMDGLRDGKGTFKYPNPFFTYTGSWSKGIAQGSGKFIMADGSSYEGSFVDGEMCGTGMRRWQSGASYSGQFEFGEMHGEGTYIGGSGEQYQGGFCRNKRHGHGVLVKPDGERYEGQFDSHRLCGRGEISYASGDAFLGEFRNNVREGNGTIQWANGSSYAGQWQADLLHGEGQFATPGGFYYHGIFDQGKAQAPSNRMVAAPFEDPPAKIVISSIGANWSALELAPNESESAMSVVLRLAGEGLDANADLETRTQPAALDLEVPMAAWEDPIAMTLPAGSQRPPFLVVELFRDGAKQASGKALLHMPATDDEEGPAEMQLSVACRRPEDESDTVFINASYSISTDAAAGTSAGSVSGSNGDGGNGAGGGSGNGGDGGGGGGGGGNGDTDCSAALQGEAPSPPPQLVVCAGAPLPALTLRCVRAVAIELPPPEGADADEAPKELVERLHQNVCEGGRLVHLRLVQHPQPKQAVTKSAPKPTKGAKAAPPAAAPPTPPPEAKTQEWDLGSVLLAAGGSSKPAVLRATMPSDLQVGEATLIISDVTASLEAAGIQPVEPLSVPLSVQA